MLQGWAITAIGGLVALSLLAAINIGRRMANSGLSEENKHEANKQNSERKGHRSEIILTQEGGELAGIKIVPFG